MYINDIVENVSLEQCLFADDCILFKEIIPSDCVMMQKDTNTLHYWSQMTNELQHQKTNLLLSYKLGYKNLSTIASYLYLGVIISGDLCWNISSGATALYLLRQIIYCGTADTEALAFAPLALSSLRLLETHILMLTLASSKRCIKEQFLMSTITTDAPHQSHQ